MFGWDRLSYDFSTEFYNNLGNYDVKITAPTDFTVISTGQLQNPNEVLASEQLSRYKQAMGSEETVSIVGISELDEGVKHKGGTWHYTASEVPDFAFCLSDHFCWDAATQKIGDRDVLIHTYYNRSVEERGKLVTAKSTQNDEAYVRGHAGY